MVCVGAEPSTLVVKSPLGRETLDENDAKTSMTLLAHNTRDIIKSYSNVKRGAMGNLVKEISTWDQEYLQNGVPSTWGRQR